MRLILLLIGLLASCGGASPRVPTQAPSDPPERTVPADDTERVDQERFEARALTDVYGTSSSGDIVRYGTGVLVDMASAREIVVQRRALDRAESALEACMTRTASPSGFTFTAILGTALGGVVIGLLSGIALAR